MRAETALQSRAFRLALSPILAPASLLYAAGLMIDRARASSRVRRLPRPTISIGNLTVGGTGKTPVMIRLLSDLLALGRHPAVLTRGYAGFGADATSGIILPGGSTAGYSDEVRLMSSKFPSVAIGVGPDRVKSAEEIAARALADVYALDDGFQHWKVARDLDIVCVDASRPWESFLLPWGLLREPVTALKRAGVILLTRCELAPAEHVARVESAVEKIAPSAAVIRTEFDLRLVCRDGKADAEAARGAAVALTSIGHPEAFERAIGRLGYTVTPLRFGDHFNYRQEDVDRAAALSERVGGPILTTEKDWAKLAAFTWPARSGRIRIAEQRLRFVGAGEQLWKKSISNAVRA